MSSRIREKWDRLAGRPVVLITVAFLLIGGCLPADPGGLTSTAFGPATSSGGSSNSTVREVGDPAPVFRLKDTDGTMLDLTSYRGRRVVLNFWATWCVPCKTEMPQLQAFYEDRRSQGIEVLAVDLQESVADVQAFRRSLGITFPTVLDTDGTVSRQYLIRGVPTTFFIDSDGVLREVHVGPIDRRGLDRRIAEMS